MPMKSPLSPLEFPDVPLHQALFPVFEAYADRIALIDAVTDQKYTYSQLLENARKIASGLRRLGVKKGDIVAIFSPNCPEWVFMFFAILLNGASVTTVNPSYTIYELTHSLKDSGTSYVFTVDPLRKLVMEAAKESGCVKKVIVNGKSGGCGCGCVSFDQIKNDDGSACPEHVEINSREDVATIPYSSGTTGLPKGVMITHYNLTSQLLQLGHPDFQDAQQIEQDLPPPVMIAFLPFFHAYGMVGIMLGGLTGGGTIVTLPRFEPEQFLAAVEKYKVSYLPLVPPVIVVLNNSKILKKYDLSSVRKIGSGAAPLAKDTEQEFSRKMGVGEFRQGYGMTETTCVATYHTPNSPAKPGSCGIPLPNMEIKVLDLETGKEVGANKRGEICLKGPNIMKGYHKRPDATANTIDTEGWLHTGDIGYFDEDCHVFVVDRLKELIKYKGFQVAPAELEALLLNHPDVADAGVIGIPDKEAGELPRAFVVRSPGSNVTEAQLTAFVAEKLSSFKHLRGGVEFVSIVPKSPSGKILRRQLRDMVKNRSKL